MKKGVRITLGLGERDLALLSALIYSDYVVSKGVYGAFMSAMYTGSTTPAVEVYLDGRQIAMAG